MFAGLYRGRPVSCFGRITYGVSRRQASSESFPSNDETGERGMQVWVSGGGQTEWYVKVKNRLSEELALPVTERKRVRNTSAVSDAGPDGRLFKPTDTTFTTDKVQEAPAVQQPKWPWKDAALAEYVQQTLLRESAGQGRMLGLAAQVFAELKELTKAGCEAGPRTYECLIAHAAKNQDKESLTQLWEAMVRAEIPVRISTWVALLRFHAAQRDANAVQWTYEAFAKSGGAAEQLDPSYISSLVQTGRRDDAWRHFRSIARPSRPVCNAALRCCTDYDSAKKLVRWMERERIGTDTSTFYSYLRVLAEVPDPAAARALYDKVADALKPHPMPHSMWIPVLMAYRNAMDLDGALKVAEEIVQQAPMLLQKVAITVIELCVGAAVEKKRLALSEAGEVEVKGSVGSERGRHRRRNAGVGVDVQSISDSQLSVTVQRYHDQALLQPTYDWFVDVVVERFYRAVGDDSALQAFFARRTARRRTGKRVSYDKYKRNTSGIRNNSIHRL
ncbi:hypothetical protein DIPPA_25245 [Diplonema papillatum]|nr:hypothetical protein DIPPA_25245 [Diplonema papillatum]